MEARRRTWFDDRGLSLDGGRRIPVYAGALDYARVDPARWPACLARFGELGLTIVEAPVAWRAHEPSPGAYAWTAERDLPRFLEAARAAGLAVMLRLGPALGAELTSAGLPDHVVADPAVQARTARGTPVWVPQAPRTWPLPSAASAAYRDQVRAWLAEVARVIAPHLAPGGPVVALGLGGPAPDGLRGAAFDADYHPDAIAAWRAATGETGEPPRAHDPAAPGRSAAWLRAKEAIHAAALAALAAMLDELGLDGIARYAEHDDAPGLPAARAIEAAIGGPAVLAARHARADFAALRRRAARLAAVGRPLALVRAGLGASAWQPPIGDADEPRDATRGGVDGPALPGHRGRGGPLSIDRDQLAALLAAGARGFVLDPLVERDRHAGAAIDAGGALESHAVWIRPAVAAWAKDPLHTAPAVALIETRADARFGLATSVIDPVPPLVAELLDLGPGGAAELGTDAGAIAARRWRDAIAAALELARVPYALVDEDAGEDELARYRAVIAPTHERIDRALWQRLRALAEARRATVVIGPGAPLRDELEAPLAGAAPRRIGRLRAGSLDDLPGLAEDLAAL